MNTSRMGRAALAGGLGFVGSAEAVELVVDGSFENTTPSSNPVVKSGGTNSPAVDGALPTLRHSSASSSSKVRV